MSSKPSVPKLGLFNGVRRRRWSRREYYQMTKAGFFSDCKVELIDGNIDVTSPQLDIHLACVTLTYEALKAAIGPDYWVRMQGTLNLGPRMMPDPDIAVTKGSMRAAGLTMPSTALLVAEVSHTTLRRDRRKGGMYAAGAIPEYWIVNIVARQLEIYRDPQPDPTQKYGGVYNHRNTFSPGDEVSLLMVPTVSVKVADLFL